MSPTPKNVASLLAQRDRIDSAAAYSQSLASGNCKAEWFEKDAQRISRPPASLGPRKDTRRELRDNGLRTGIEAVKLARQARLREMLEREALQYEAELGSMGLSLVKPRD